MKFKRYIILFHPIGKEKSVRIDFESDKPATDFYEKLKIEGYKMYQFIQADFKYNMKESELEEKEIEYLPLEREKKVWFGFSKKMVSDLFISPKKGFFYPYQFGHYFYLFTKKKINKNDFENWLNLYFPKRFADFDKTYAGLKKEQLELMNEDDYFIITSHDSQKEFGLIGKNGLIEKLIEKLRHLNLKSFEEIKS